MRRAGVALVVRLACVALMAFAANAPAQQPGNAWDGALRASQAAIGRSIVGEVDTLPLRDTLNRRVTLADYRGQPLVLSFIYTGCFQACPVTTHRLAEGVRAARRALGEASFQVVSIGFNQPFDDPVAMGAFARQMRIADPRWTFLSVDAADVPRLTQAFGFSFAATPKGFDHLTQATIVDAQGRIAAQVYGENFELPQFVGPLKDLMAGQAARTVSVDSLWRKVKLYCTVYDPASGGYRLNYSLFFELLCGVSVLVALALFMTRELRREMRPPRSLRSLPPEGGPAADRRSRIRARPWLGRFMRRVCRFRGMEH
jgi:protein SCO1